LIPLQLRKWGYKRAKFLPLGATLRDRPMSNESTVLVIGATGTQGGKVARALTAASRRVRALVRDPLSPAARALAGLDIAIVPGDLDSDDALAQAFEGVSAVFVALPAARGTTNEMERARRVARIAVRAGIRQSIYSSVSGTGWRRRGEDLYHDPDHNYWDNKEVGEQAFREAGFETLTIVKPTIIMEDFLPPKSSALFAELAQAHIALAIAPYRKIALIAADDLAAATVAALTDPDKFRDAEIEMAGDLLTMGEIAQILSDATGTPITWETISMDEVLSRGQSPSLLHTYRLLDGPGYPARPHHMERYGLLPTRFREWAMAHSSGLKAQIGQ
jgi:uncharacterized protein YbjT (DUF2867 family)